MKKIHKLVIGAFIGPFIATFFVTLFILVMQFLWKYVDEFVGKGLEWYLLAELLFYASANLVPLALPLAVLLSSIMTFGNLGEHYELAAMKSAGISLQRVMYPLIVFTFFLSIGAFYFSNSIWPSANLKFATLLYDIRHKKPALDIKPEIYYKEIDGYVIRVDSKSKDGKILYDLLIYDHTEKRGNVKVIRAKEGIMKISDDELSLLLQLYNGNSYEEKPDKSRPFFRTEFEEQLIRFDLSTFKMQKSDEDLFKDNYQMLNMNQLSAQADTLDLEKAERLDDFNDVIYAKYYFTKDSTDQRQFVKRMHNLEKSKLRNDSSFAEIIETYKSLHAEVLDQTNGGTRSYFQSFVAKMENTERENLLNNMESYVRSARTYSESMTNEYKSRTTRINRHWIEWHRKMTLPVACMVLFFIGAPLGAIIRKGGLGMPVVVSIGFFLIFHISGMTGERLAKSGDWDPLYGMWLSTVVLFPIGVFLTYKATTDSTLLDSSAYSSLIKTVAKPFKRRTSKKQSE